MTPKGKTANSTTLMIERKPVVIKEAANDKVHVGGGDHQGIVINKVITEGNLICQIHKHEIRREDCEMNAVFRKRNQVTSVVADWTIKFF